MSDPTRRLLKTIRSSHADRPEDLRGLLWLVAAAIAQGRGLLDAPAAPESFVLLARSAGLAGAPIPDAPRLPDTSWLEDCGPADVSLLGEVYASLMPSRRARGGYYTPPALAQSVARLTLAPYLTDSPSPGGRGGRGVRVLDPAMGSGRFLIAAGEVIAADLTARGAAPDQARRDALKCLYGSDNDPLAVELARLSLWLWAGVPVPVGRLRCADALLDQIWPDRFDAVIGNPPFASVFTRARASHSQREALRARFESARGSFDLSALFVEQAIRLCRAGGRVGLVLPNKLLSADYARPLREWLSARAALETLIDARRDHGFRASVYPVACVWRVGAPEADDPLEVVALCPNPKSRPAPFSVRLIRAGRQSDLHIIPGEGWGGALHPDWDTLCRCYENAVMLGDVTTLAAGLMVGEAYDLRAAVFDAPEGDLPDGSLRLITSGLVRPHRSAWGETPARFLRVTYARPAVPAAALPLRRAAQARLPKIIVAGMGLTPRACLDDGRSQASVATTIISGSRWPLAALCALINSRSMGRLCRAVYGGLALGGGHLRFGKRELSRLPIPDLPGDHPQVMKLARLAADSAFDEIDTLAASMFRIDAA